MTLEANAMTDTDKRIALVTGASRGIGKSIALTLGKQGMTVIGTATSEQGATAIAEYLREAGIPGTGMCLNVASDESVASVFDAIESAYGAPSVLVNNAGITRDKFFPKMETGQWQAVINTNLNSLFNVTHHISPKMAERGWGRIINISSVNGVKGQAGQTNYSTAKAGVLGFTKALAQELATKGVTVNAIAPGYIATDMVMAIREDVRQAITDTVPMKRLGKPEEIGGLCAYLASEMAGYITGSTVNINGGLHMA